MRYLPGVIVGAIFMAVTALIIKPLNTLIDNLLDLDIED